MPRREPRFPVPLFNIPIKVVLTLGSEQRIGQLWDISRGGACARFTRELPSDTSLSTQLRIHAPYSGEVIESRARVAWCNALGPHHYSGLEILDPVDFNSTFLARLMREPRQ